MDAGEGSTPGEAALFDALEETWPPEEAHDIGALRLRFAPGAGSRVNSARLLAPLTGGELTAAFDEAAAAYHALGQPALLQLGESDPSQALVAQIHGFEEFDPCHLLVGDSAVAAAGAGGQERSEARTLSVDTPLAAFDEMWAEGDGGPARRAVMARASGPSREIAARLDDRIIGAVFASVSGGICFAHALHVAPQIRGRGAGRALMRAAARFGLRAGAGHIAVSVRRGNAAAAALFEALGMGVAGGYAYWRKEP